MIEKAHGGRIIRFASQTCHIGKTSAILSLWKRNIRLASVILTLNDNPTYGTTEFRDIRVPIGANTGLLSELNWIFLIS
jgi:hypothetical protein